MNNFTRFGSLMVAIPLLLTACGKDNYVYYSPKANALSTDYKIKEIGSNRVDIMWVIDNSGSMMTYQQTVIKNAAAFMQDFYTQKLDWKMGLVSTDESEAPYVGFAGSPQLDSTVPDAVNVWQNAVGKLGTNGSATEKTFIPIIKALTNDPTFERKNTPIVFITVTDAVEQSTDSYGTHTPLDAPAFLAALKPLVNGRDMYVYNVLSTRDQGCTSFDEGPWDYKGSAYETFALAAKFSRVFPLCTDFGANLALMGHEIAVQVTHPTIYLNKRPNPDTVQVIYKGKPLPAGTTEQGGYWKYDYSLNAIVFNSLDFSTNDTDAVTVSFAEDTGTSV